MFDSAVKGKKRNGLKGGEVSCEVCKCSIVRCSRWEGKEGELIDKNMSIISGI